MSHTALARAIVEDHYPKGDQAQDLVQTPAQETPSGIEERTQQSVMKERRIRFIFNLMLADQWHTGITGYNLAEQWWPKLDDKHRNARIRALAEAASTRIGLDFDRKQVAQNIVTRMEGIQREAIRNGRPMVAIHAAKLQAEMAGAGRTDNYGPSIGVAGDMHQTTSIQVVNVSKATGEPEVVTTSAMAALVRGRPQKPVEAPVEPST